MAYIKNFLGSDLACIDILNWDPETASIGVNQDFTFDVTISGATIASVSVDPGDASGSVAASLVSGNQWTVTLNYAAGGTYRAVITVTDSNADIQQGAATVVVS